MQSLCFFLLFLFVIPLAQAQPSTGGYEPIPNLLDLHVREIASFAVSQLNNKIRIDLKFLDIFEAYSEIVEGTNFNLTFIGVGLGYYQYCNAVVYENPDKALKLTSFTLLPKPAQGYMPAPCTDPFERSLVYFAVTQYNKNQTQHHPIITFDRLHVALHRGTYGDYDHLLYIAANLPDSSINPLHYRAKVHAGTHDNHLISFDNIPVIPDQNYIQISATNFKDAFKSF